MELMYIDISKLYFKINKDLFYKERIWGSRNNLCFIRNIIMLILFIQMSSCKKFVDIDPPKTQLIKTTVFENDATAIAAVIGIYGSMERNSTYSVSGTLGLSSDELKDYSTSTTSNEFYNNSLGPTNSGIASIWNNAYKYIYTANSIIEGLESSSTMTLQVKQQLSGEAKFIRAFWYFYLVNMFDDVPLITTTDYKSNSVSFKSSSSEIYQLIINDLKDAYSLLTDNYVDANNNATTERVRPNKWTASALLARIYLYKNDWVNAELHASSIISNSSRYSLVTILNSVFLKNSTEAIWQIMPTNVSRNTLEGNSFILTGTPSTVALSNYVLNGFESGDNRRNAWVGNITVGQNIYYFPLKYKIKSIASGTAYTEYSMVFRLAEQFLIRAEARAQQDKINDAQVDLNIVRHRAGLGDTPAGDKTSLLTAILHERQVELFTEWGHRWFDLKRTNKADAILGPIKGANWQSTDVLYPIPQMEILNDPNLTQNNGY
jgi:starch-binding outer membrane protein, SusD/RagB family